MDYREIMRGQWDEIKKTNPQYSLRSFAKKLDLDPSTLSQVLRGKRDLPATHIQRIISRLKLSPEDQKNFLKTLDPYSLQSYSHNRYLNTPTIDDQNNQIVVKILEELDYGALFALVGTKEFKPDPSWMAYRLKLTEKRVNEVLENLLSIGLIIKTEDSYVKGSADLKTSDNVTNLALQKAHATELELAQTALREVPIELRDFTSMTLAIDTKKIKEAQVLIRAFLKQMDELLETEDADEVYQMNVQLFPLSHITRKDQ